MALGMELRLRMAQQLVMTPQLQLAIRLLQMSNLELDDFLREELEKNPLLEQDGPGDDASGGDGGEQGGGEERASREERFDGDDGSGGGEEAPGFEDRELPPEPKQLDDDLQVDASWSDIYDDSSQFGYTLPPSSSSSSSSDDSDSPFLENTLTHSETLVDHLVWQLTLSALLSERERALGLLLIDAIDDNGYLVNSLESLAELSGATVDELEDALILIQSFEPAGVGARSLAECLYLQLKAKGMAHPPHTLLLDHLPDLARRDFRKLTRKLKISEEELGRCMAVIQSLNPKPGLAFGSDTARYILADVLVRRNPKGEWVVEVNPEMMPRLRVNNQYQAAMANKSSSQDQRFVSEHIRSARWLIKSLEQRSNTIFRVAESIVRFQTDFLEHGPERLKPLILKDVADDIGVHESTISRVTSNKYMHTPRGIFELKYFFSSSLTGGLGQSHSSESVRFKIRKLVDEEPPNKPLSDEKIADLLNEQGINVARRTVAKYRESMGILSSSRRKQLSG